MTETSWQSLAHSRWECKYHVVFIPKYRRKAIYGEIRASLGGIFHELARQKEWGRRLAIGTLAANLIGDCVSALVRHDPRTLIGLPIGGAMIAYLWKG